MKDREKEFIRIQEKNDHYILYIAVGGLSLSLLVYDKISFYSYKIFLALGLLFFVFSVILFLASRDYSKKVAGKEEFLERKLNKIATKEKEKINQEIIQINSAILKIDKVNLFLVIFGCFSSGLFFMINLMI